MALEQERAQKRANMMKFSTRYLKLFIRQNILLSDLSTFMFYQNEIDWIPTDILALVEPMLCRI